jgi:hypothetical protein
MTSEEAQKDYLDRVCESLRTTGNQINRALYSYSVLSIGAIAFLLELIHTSAGYTLFGVSLTFSLPFLLAAISTGIACGLMYHTGLIFHEERLCDTAVDLYRAAGFDHPTLKASAVHPLEVATPPTAVLLVTTTAVNFRRVHRLVRWLTMIIFLGLPLFAQIAITARLASLRFAPWALGTASVLLINTVHLWAYTRTDKRPAV